MTPEQERERDSVRRLVLAFAWTLLGFVLYLRLQGWTGIALIFGLEALGWLMAFKLRSRAYPKGLPTGSKAKMEETPLQRYLRRHLEIEERGKAYGAEISSSFLQIFRELSEAQGHCRHEFRDFPYKDCQGNTIGTFQKCSLCSYDEPVSRGRFKDGQRAAPKAGPPPHAAVPLP
jgi:hypothetical protein